MTKQKIKFEELRSLQVTVEKLEGLLQGLRAGTLRLSNGATEVDLRPGGAVHLGVEVECDGDREKLELSLAWRRATSSASAAAGAVPDAESEMDNPLTEEEPATLRRPESPARAQTIREREVERQTESREPASQQAARSTKHDAGKRDASELTDSLRSMAAVAAAKYQELYVAARVPRADGAVRLDEERYAQSLAAAGADPLTQQALCRLAREADADGRATLLEDEILAALRKAS